MPSKIMVVDDDTDSLKLIGLMLQRQNYEVVTASSGKLAIEQAFATAPDLIILDVMMPDMDGYTVCRHLRNDPRTVDTPIIMFTAKTLVDDKVAGFEAGADDYLTKPTHPAELAARVQAVLARSAARAQQAAASGGSAVPTPQRPSISYAFIGAKGGVGLSTLAMNIGAVIAQHESVSLVDFRPGRGTLGLSLGLARSLGLANLLAKNISDINAKVVGAELTEHKSGLTVLPSTPRARESQVNIAPDMARAIVRSMGELTQHVLIDLGAGLNQLTMSLVRDVNRVVFAVESNKIALAMGRDILNELRQVGISRNKTSVVIIHRHESKVQVPWQEAEQLLENEIMAVISSAPDLMYQALDAEMPIALNAPDTVIATQYAKLAEEVVRRSRVEMN